MMSYLSPHAPVINTLPEMVDERVKLTGRAITVIQAELRAACRSESIPTLSR